MWLWVDEWELACILFVVGISRGCLDGSWLDARRSRALKANYGFRGEEG